MGIWAQASELAAATPPDRNRYVDCLRAVSIFLVILGHWLITTAYYNASDDTLAPMLALDAVPWTAWLTWIFQVMPIFFIVGGFANAVSLDGAAQRQLNYAQWLTGRLHRLLTPLLVLVVFWGLLATGLLWFGLSTENIVFVTRTALVPTWFLAIYTMIVLLAPATYALWRRWGYWSLFGYIGLAALVDYAFFVPGWEALGWTNYFWVWLAAHHLGFAWYDGRLGKPMTLLAIAAISLVVLAALILVGPYPIAMAGSPGDAVSNTLPPKITLIALCLCQFGILLAIEKPMQRLLAGSRLWTATVLVNTMIMTVYLWHMTVLLLVLAVCYYIGGIGLTTEVGSTSWWLTRPAWLAVMVVLLIPVALLMSPLERVSRPKDSPVPAAWRLVLGAAMVGAGITMATLLGFNGNLLSFWHTGLLALLLGGALVCGVRLKFNGS